MIPAGERARRGARLGGAIDPRFGCASWAAARRRLAVAAASQPLAWRRTTPQPENRPAKGRAAALPERAREQNFREPTNSPVHARRRHPSSSPLSARGKGRRISILAHQPRTGRDQHATMGQKRNSSTMEEREARKRARMERNRLSAARHRQQQRDLIASLQQQLAAALAENDRLRRGLPVPGSPIVTTEPAVFTLFSTPSSGIVCDDRRAGAPLLDARAAQFEHERKQRAARRAAAAERQHLAAAQQQPRPRQHAKPVRPRRGSEPADAAAIRQQCRGKQCRK